MKFKSFLLKYSIYASFISLLFFVGGVMLFLFPSNNEGSECKALPKTMENNPALRFDCREISPDISRCKNWEAVCIVGQGWANCTWMNPPKTAHWTKKLSHNK
jgi:hypothetical protein